MPKLPIELFKKAFAEHDAGLFRKLLERHPELKAKINEPVAAFDAPVITRARSREMLDVLLEAGADINARRRWPAGGVWLLRRATPEVFGGFLPLGAPSVVLCAPRLRLAGQI